MNRWIEPTLTDQASPLPNLPPLVGQVLLRRGYTTAAEAHAFLDPAAYQSSPPDDLPGMIDAVERITRAIRAKEQICVWGDFDVDGQTSTTVLVQTLQALGARVSFHIPVRGSESHGVNIENLARVIAQGARLIVTCDTGISAAEAVAYARSRGVETVITDHHDLPPELPQAAALVNPKLISSRGHPLASLAGVGVAYKLAEGLANRLEPADFNVESLLDLVALGLVADLAILRGDARYLVQKGLAELRVTKRLGLKIMMELAELAAPNLTEEHIGFALGPRLNAIGRLGDANPVVELLTTSDPVRARVLAAQLEGLNIRRKMLCDQVHQAAEAQLRANPELLTQAAIVLGHPAWPGGVVGIVASRLVERYQKPAILLSTPTGEAARGSARSIEGVNITAAIAQQKDLLLSYGGHPMAAGLALAAEKLPEFRRRLSKSVEAMLTESGEREGLIEIDAWLSLNEAGLDLAGQLESLAPFGPGNPKLVLASRDLEIKSATPLGKNNEHLKLSVADRQGTSAQVIWWDGGSETPPYGRFDLAYTLRASDWRGEKRAQLELVDFHELDAEKVELKTRKLEVLDYRNRENPLETLRTEFSGPHVVCWAEGEHKKAVGGRDRNELMPARTLVLWSIPPSTRELKAALEKVQPERAVVFGLDPGNGTPRTFVDRLAGLVKFIINRRAGQTTVAELAAATAQSENAARSGLEWLSAQAQITARIDTNGDVRLTAGGQVDPLMAELAQARLAALLEESRAYRLLFRGADTLNLG